MRGVRKKVVALCAGALATMAVVAIAPAGAAPQTKVLLTDLNSPKGLGTDGSNFLAVSQGAFGEPPAPDPVIVYELRPNEGNTFPVTDPTTLVDVAISPLDGTGWGIGSTDLQLYHQLQNGTIVRVLNIPRYQTTDPDPADQEGQPTESNPYGLTILPNGDALVTDAANNDLIRVTPKGKATTVARFDVELVSTDHVPPEEGLPPQMNAEAVPTTVTLGPDGFAYVGELKGFPFRPGSSRIWRIDPNAVGALCSSSGSTGGCSQHASGFTAIQDIAFNNPSSTYYVYELAEGGVFAFEGGFGSGDFPPAVLLQVKAGQPIKEIATGQLSEPGGVVVVRGAVYVTDGVFTGGRLLRVL